MTQDLTMAYSLIKEQGEQIVSMMQLLEANVAIREAQNTLLQSLIPFVKDNPDFGRIIKEVHSLRLKHHLEKDVSNLFIERYNEAVNALLPPGLRFPPPTIKIKDCE